MRLSVLSTAVLTLVAAVASGKASAHEFWISPERYQVAPQEPIIAALRIGEAFDGWSFAYLDTAFVRFDILMGDKVTPVRGRMGDLPAMQVPAPGEGLAVVVHETKAMLVTYSEWTKFETFLAQKDLTWAIEDHHSRKLPVKDFQESYTRFAKSLVAIGAGRGQDRVVGLETEIVALGNPYTDRPDDGLPIKVLYQGNPRRDVQVEVFMRTAEGKVDLATVRTDAEGLVRVPLHAGTEYLIDAVVLRPLASKPEGGPVWESLWASLTFRTPDAPPR